MAKRVGLALELRLTARFACPVGPALWVATGWRVVPARAADAVSQAGKRSAGTDPFASTEAGVRTSVQAQTPPAPAQAGLAAWRRSCCASKGGAPRFPAWETPSIPGQRGFRAEAWAPARAGRVGFAGCEGRGSPRREGCFPAWESRPTGLSMTAWEGCTPWHELVRPSRAPSCPRPSTGREQAPSRKCRERSEISGAVFLLRFRSCCWWKVPCPCKRPVFPSCLVSHRGEEGHPSVRITGPRTKHPTCEPARRLRTAVTGMPCPRTPHGVFPGWETEGSGR